MSNDTATKLRVEIQDGKKMRHAFVMRKFSLATALLGFGSLSTKLASGTEIDLAALLYLVPFIAIAFDLYIFTEDYRIKRAGEFLRKEESGAPQQERSWENFAKEYPNNANTLAFSLVTIIFIAGASVVLWQTEPDIILFSLWLGVVVSIEVVLASFGFKLRSSLEQSKLPKKDE